MFAEHHEDKVSQSPETPSCQAIKRIEYLEAIHEKQRQHSGLFGCAVFLLTAHALAFVELIGLSFKWNQPFPVWIAAGGIGSLAVWFAFTARPLLHRILMAATVLIGIHLACGPSLTYFSNSQNAQLRTDYVQSYLMTKYFPANSFQPLSSGRMADSSTMLLGWILGALLAAYCYTWFSGFRLTIPGTTPIKRKPLSIRTMFMMTVVAAIASQFLSREYFVRQAFHYSHGLTVGLLAAVVAWSVFRDGRKRLLVPLGVAALVILGDATVGWMVGAWHGSLLQRIQVTGLFTVSVSVSPLATFVLLKHFGYEKL